MTAFADSCVAFGAIMECWCIKDWDDVFESRHSRAEKGPRRYVLLPTERQSEAYVTLMGSAAGQSAYAVFVGLLRIAARCPRRGVLADDKGPYTPKRIAEKLRVGVGAVDRAITTLSAADVGWLRRTSAGASAGQSPVEAPDKRRESAGQAPGKAGDSGLGLGLGQKNTHPNPPASGREQGEIFAGEWESCRVAIETLRRVLPTTDAASTLDRCADAMAEAGYAVQREYPVPDRGDGISGRVDLLAFGHGGTVAIEIDRASERAKSVAKLRSLSAWRVIVLREAGRTDSKPDGIAAVVGLASGTDAKPARVTRAVRKAAESAAVAAEAERILAARAARKAERNGVTP